MSLPTLTLEQATALYEKGVAYFDDYGNMTTRTASYTFDTDMDIYTRVLSGLRVVHHTGVRWNGKRFVRCACAHCERHADEASTVRIYEGVI